MSIVSGATKLLDVSAVITTALMTSVDWELPWGATGAIFVVDVTTLGSPTSGGTFRIQGKDETTGKYYQINATPAAITATGTYVYVVYPSAVSPPGSGSDIAAVTNASFIPPKGRVLINRVDGTWTVIISMTPIMP